MPGHPCRQDRVIDCTGQIVLPGAVDVHVHMRGGSQLAKEDWETGSRSALAGGVTVVVDQPNTVPPLTDPAAFSRRVADAQAHSLCSFAINSAVTPQTPVEAMWEAGAMAFGETFFAPSSYWRGAFRSRSLPPARAYPRSRGPCHHPRRERLPGSRCRILQAHDALRSPEGERDAVLAVQACNTSGCRLHFCHMSSALSIAAAKGTVEVTPHHLFLSREKVRDNDTRFKVNPPVRSERERKALFACWDRIDVIASDHAPHTMTEKAQEFSLAPSGVPGVETMVPLLMAEVLEKRLLLPDVIQKTSTAPAALIGIPPTGFVPGDRADFAIYPKKAVTIEADLLHSKCGWTPVRGDEGGLSRYRDPGRCRGVRGWRVYPDSPRVVCRQGIFPGACTFETVMCHEQQMNTRADKSAPIGPRVIEWQMPGSDPWDNPGARQASPGARVLITGEERQQPLVIRVCLRRATLSLQGSPFHACADRCSFPGQKRHAHCHRSLRRRKIRSLSRRVQSVEEDHRVPGCRPRNGRKGQQGHYRSCQHSPWRAPVFGKHRCRPDLVRKKSPRIRTYARSGCRAARFVNDS